MRVNQRGDPIAEEFVFGHVGDATPTDQDRNDAIALILEHLGLEIISTNATKHGDTVLELRKVAP